MKDALKDTLRATKDLNFSIIQLTGNGESTLIEAVNDNKNVILKGKFKKLVHEFDFP